MREKNTTCPICNGTGEIESPKSLEIDAVAVKKEMAQKLRFKGYSLRQIQNVLGYKSVRSVVYLLEK